jgi:aconitate hydratase
MVNGLAILGWGVGGIEAEAAMLGQPISMLIPEVIGMKFTGKLREGVTATDLVLTVTQILRKKGVVSKFVEYYGEGLAEMPLEDRATIGNMVPEYGATCGYFPIDAETLRFLKATGRAAPRIALVEKYAKAQGMFHTKKAEEPVFTDTLTLDLSTVEPSLSGPRRPQDRVALANVGTEFAAALKDVFKKGGEEGKRVPADGYSVGHGDVAIAAITSCTNTSNPYVMLGAGLMARNALAKGLSVKPWVKTSMAPGSQVVADYLKKSKLDAPLSKLGFSIVAYGCTTCIGNSGPLPDPVAKAVTDGDLVVSSVISGNRNFEGRVHPQVRANYLASPMLVVAYALAGTITGDLTTTPIGTDKKGKPVYLKDIWPSPKEIANTVRKSITPAMYKKRYSNVFAGDKAWKKIKVAPGKTYRWDDKSTYVKNPPYFQGMTGTSAPVMDAKGSRILGIFGDSITTDHISPAGSIKKDSPAGKYLIENGVAAADFNSYGARRGNHEVMMRGTFANIRIRNEMLGGKEGGNTICYADNPQGVEMSIYDAAMKYMAKGTPSVIVAGKEYGSGSSRDWAAKGPALLGIRAAIVESFERIHRSNLIGMGIVPFEFANGKTRRDYGLTGKELIDIPIKEAASGTRKKVTAKITYPDGRTADLPLVARIDTADEIGYFNSGGILHYVLRNLAAA